MGRLGNPAVSEEIRSQEIRELVVPGRLRMREHGSKRQAKSKRENRDQQYAGESPAPPAG
jgi:hypothetical protein